MAHIVLATRGHLKEVKRFIKDLSSQYLDFPMYNKETKRMQQTILEMRVQPVQLWDIVYPKAQRDAVLNTILAMNDGMPMNPKMNKYLAIFRKLMGLKKLGKYDKKHTLRMKLPQHIELIAVGEKDDYWITEDGKHVDEKDKTELSQEGL